MNFEHTSALYVWYIHKLCIYLLTYLLTPCSTVLVEKLTGSQLVKKFPAFYGTRRFITAFTGVRNLSYPGPAASIPYYPFLFPQIHRNLFPFTIWCPKWTLSVRFPILNPLYASPLPYSCCMPLPSHSSRFYQPNNVGWALQIIKLLTLQFSPLPCYPQTLSSTPYFQTQSACVSPSMWATKFHTHSKKQAKLYFCMS